MGKATILQSLGSGHYRIRVEFENAKVEARLTIIDQQITELTTKLAELATQKQAAKDQFNADSAALNFYLNNTTFEEYQNNPQPMNALTAELYKSRLAYDVILGQERREKLKKTGIEKDKLYLSKYCPKDFEAFAWCVAFKENLSGIIKTIECDYLLERDVITNQIRNDTGFWLPATAEAPDSQLQHPMASGVHANWFNLAMYPALQKDKGHYRIATITSLNKPANTCNLSFDGYYNIHEHTTQLIDDKPIVPKFDVNGAQQINYIDANIVYMTCNAEAFEVGDRVIVDLHLGVGVPTVVGFYENPRQCPTAPTPPWTTASTFYNIPLTLSVPTLFANEIKTAVYQTIGNTQWWYQFHLSSINSGSGTLIRYYRLNNSIPELPYLVYIVNGNSNIAINDGTPTSQTVNRTIIANHLFTFPIGPALSLTWAINKTTTISIDHLMEGSDEIVISQTDTINRHDIKVVLDHISYVSDIGLNSYDITTTESIENSSITNNNQTATATGTGGVTITIIKTRNFINGTINYKAPNNMWQLDYIVYSETFTPQNSNYSQAFGILYSIGQAIAPNMPPADISTSETQLSGQDFGIINVPNDWALMPDGPP